MLWVYKNKDNNFDYINSDSKPNANAQLVSANLWSEPTEFLVASESTVTDELGNEKIVYSVSLDQGSKDAAAAQKQAVQDALAAFQTLNEEIIADAAQVAGTTNQISGLMDLLTYMRMKDSPQLFDGEGLVAKKAVTGFTQGEALDTVLKITNYAEAMLAESDQFMIRRMKKITDYILS